MLSRNLEDFFLPFELCTGIGEILLPEMEFQNRLLDFGHRLHDGHRIRKAFRNIGNFGAIDRKRFLIAVKNRGTETGCDIPQEFFEKFRRENIPIMIGTQMVTKGLNFDKVTLVGVIFADQSLYAGDYRASERSFSLMTQVIGRSGRADRKGRAVIQTFTPENQVIRFAAKQDYEAFYQREIEIRRLQRCPPFVQIVSLSVIGTDEFQVLNSCERIRALLLHALKDASGVDVLGPAPYPVVKAAGRYRYRLTLRSESEAPLRGIVTRILNYCNREPEFRGISVYADRNPLE